MSRAAAAQGFDTVIFLKHKDNTKHKKNNKKEEQEADEEDEEE